MMFSSFAIVLTFPLHHLCQPDPLTRKRLFIKHKDYYFLG